MPPMSNRVNDLPPPPLQAPFTATPLPKNFDHTLLIMVIALKFKNETGLTKSNI